MRPPKKARRPKAIQWSMDSMYWLKMLVPSQPASGIKPWNAWRICLVGAGQGPDMYEWSAFLGKTETLGRMQHAIDILG